MKSVYYIVPFFSNLAEYNFPILKVKLIGYITNMFVGNTITNENIDM